MVSVPEIETSLQPDKVRSVLVPGCGSAGLLAALLGLGAPFRHHPEIPAPERKAWESVCRQRRQMAKQAIPAELCLGAARRAVTPEKRVPLF